MINLRAAASFLLLSCLLVGCGMLDTSSTKKNAPIGLISTPISYYSTPKAKYLGTKYKENLDRLVEEIVRNPKTTTLQFANNISSVGGIGFFTHSATKTPDERYLEVVLATPETFETKGEYSEKIQQLFSLYGFDLLKILNSDRDIYQDPELAGYGLNLAWRNVVSDPASGGRVMLARAIIYLPKEKVRSYLRSEIKQNDLLANAVIFGEEEDGPLALVSYRPQDPKPDFRAAIHEDNLSDESQPKPNPTPAKQSIAQANQKTERAQGDASSPKPGSSYAPTKPNVTEVDNKGEAANAAAQAPAPEPAERDHHRTGGPTISNEVAAAESKEGAGPNRSGSSQNQVESLPESSAPVTANNQPQVKAKTGAVQSERQVALRGEEPTELAKASATNSQTPQPGNSPIVESGQAVTTSTAGADAAPSPKPTAFASKTNAEPATTVMANLPKESSALVASENSDHAYSPQEPAEQKSHAEPVAANTHAAVPQPVEKDEITALKSSAAQPAIKSDANAPLTKSVADNNGSNVTASAALPEKLSTSGGSVAPASTSHSSVSDLNDKPPVQVSVAPVKQPTPVPEVRRAPEQLAALKKPSDTTIERKAIARPGGRALEGFIIQIAFNDKDKAQHWAEAMERRGYAVSVTETGGEGALRVRLGNFPIRDDAERQLRSLKQEGMNGIIINLPQAFQPVRSSVP